jgi:GT2 family glycosyltransferase
MPAHLIIERNKPKVSIIIPSLDGSRGGNVEKLISDIKGQSFQDYELILVKGESPNGHARNVGAKTAKGEILVCDDDDAVLSDSKVINNLIVSLERDQQIGMTGASIDIPNDANWFQKLIPKESFGGTYPVKQDKEAYDEVQHTCCALSKRAYEFIGGENDRLISGTDVDLRYRLKKAGYRLVLAANCRVFHKLPDSPAKLWRQQFNFGYGTPLFMKECPEITPLRELGSFFHVLFFIAVKFVYALFSFFIVIKREKDRRKLYIRFTLLGPLFTLPQDLGYVCGYYKFIKKKD